MNIIKRRDYRMVVLSDEHCGHASGLTPPEFQGKFISEDISKHNKLINNQRCTFNNFSKEIIALKKEQKIDICVNNGDAIDGTGWRSGGTELITTDRTKQVLMAKSILTFVGAEKNIVIAGTGYHTGEQEDFEEILANEVKGKFGSHEFLNINNQGFDFKHHCGSSSVPHGRHTPVAKEAIWNKLWTEAGLIPDKTKYLIRSHVHYYSCIEDDRMVSLTTPALQGFGSKFGSRRCSGIPTIGFLSFDIKANGTIIMRKHFMDLNEQKAKAMIFK
jgi:hypothetical protein